MLRDLHPGPLTPAQEAMLERWTAMRPGCGNLIEDVLTLSKIEAGAVNSVTQPVDLAEVVAAAAGSSGPEAVLVSGG